MAARRRELLMRSPMLLTALRKKAQKNLFHRNVMERHWLPVVVFCRFCVIRQPLAESGSARLDLNL
jgi:hypothetical protein